MTLLVVNSTYLHLCPSYGKEQQELFFRISSLTEEGNSFGFGMTKR